MRHAPGQPPPFDLIHRIHDAAGEPEPVSTLLSEISARLGDATIYWVCGLTETRAATIHAHDPAGVDPNPWDPAALDRIPWFAHVRSLPGSLVDVRRHMRSEEVRGGEFCSAWVLSRGLEPVSVLARFDPPEEEDAGSLLAVFGREGAPSFGAFEVELAGVIASHLAIAARTWARTEALRRERDGLLCTVDRLRIGVVLTEDDGAVVSANAAARAFLSDSGALHLRDGRVASEGHAETRALRRAIAETSRSGQHEVSRQCIPLRTSAGEQLQVEVHRACPVDPWSERSAWLAAIFVDGPTLDPFGAEGRLRETFGLTAAEARLASALGRGVSAARYAAQTGRSIHTIRTQAKRVYAKMGIHRRAELVRIVSGGLGVVDEAS